VTRVTRKKLNLHRGHRGTEGTEKHSAPVGRSPRVRTSVPASPGAVGAVQKEVGCPFIRTQRDWECVWQRRDNFLASADRQIRITPRSEVQFGRAGSRFKRTADPSAFGPRDDSSICGVSCLRSTPVHLAHSARGWPAESRVRAYIYFNARVKRARDERDPSLAMLFVNRRKLIL
jgi:hypothetical protein